MSNSNLNNPHIVMLEIGDITAGAAASLPGFTAPRKMRVTDVKLINNVALAGDDVNNVAVTLKEKGGNDIATYTNDVASGGLAQREGKDMTLSATDADLVKSGGTHMEISVSHNGTGQALTGAKLQIMMYPI